jgi:hypothetical protein
MKKNLPRPVRHPLRLNDPLYRWDKCPAVSTQPVRFGQMYPGRRFALPWAISFCPFGAAGSMVDCYLPGPSTPAEGVPALRAYELQDATYRGLRPRQRVCRPFGPMSDKIAIYRGRRPRQRVCRPFGPMQPQDCYFPGPSTPAEGVPALRAYAATRLLFSGAFDPGRGCASPSGL